MIKALKPEGGRILDVRCADGFLLLRLPASFERFSIEVNTVATVCPKILSTCPRSL
jgi:hypothetical protein